MPNFWPNCGYSTLQVNADQQLLITDDFLRIYLARPELALIPESCVNERAIHQLLINNPRALIDDAELDKMADPDIRENYRIWFRYRSKLITASSLEHFYLSLFEGSGVDVPPLFVAQLTQIFLRHILGEEVDPLEARMAELFFRPQKVSIFDEGAVMAADHEVVEQHAQAEEFGNIVDLLKNKNLAMRTLDLDVLNADNAVAYWDRNESYDFAIQLNYDQAPMAALCRVLEKWLVHFLGIAVKINALKDIHDPKWVWHVGLDATATQILNGLYNKEMVDEATLARVIGLLRLDFIDESAVMSEIKGKPIYLGLAITEDSLLKLKPQNLLFNLPLAKKS